MCVCVCIFIYVYVYIYTYIYLYAYIKNLDRVQGAWRVNSLEERLAALDHWERPILPADLTIYDYLSANRFVAHSYGVILNILLHEPWPSSRCKKHD